VVRAQLQELFNCPPAGFRVEPVYLAEWDGRWSYRYARHYSSQVLNTGKMLLADDKVDFAPGDIFYAPDFHPNGVSLAHEDGLFRDMKSKGVAINILIHDLLPVTMPQHFPSEAALFHQRWLLSVSDFADRLICISQAAADDYVTWAAANLPAGTVLPTLAVNHHGANIGASLPSTGLPRKAVKLLDQLAAAPTFIMVGTIEPRKGHLQTLAAFSLLWQQGIAVNLVVVGKKGWSGLPLKDQGTIPDIARQLDAHPQRNRQLFWLQGISDEYLEALYAASDCLLAASEDEGFGLPLIEAALQGVPVLARDIPVFREVAADQARYFQGSQPQDLAGAIVDWLERHRRGEIARPQSIAVKTWADNVAELKKILLP
jgi:glycosyltransferase involved in cell wall biosynthesis